jgi:hypothetical protein
MRLSRQTIIIIKAAIDCWHRIDTTWRGLLGRYEAATTVIVRLHGSMSMLYAVSVSSHDLWLLTPARQSISRSGSPQTGPA